MLRENMHINQGRMSHFFPDYRDLKLNLDKLRQIAYFIKRIKDD
tara:strand:+ start:78994 stop:79125 length:132 start_codon:yes stop_codon:yes gene_type:complete